jgi:translation initiation factor 2B subunit (eIF-2B alpha/beta/delta family)
MISKAFLRDVKIIHEDTHSGAAKIAQNCLIALKQECFASSSQLNRSFLKELIQLLLDTHPMATIENALLPIFISLDKLIHSENFKKRDPKPAIDMIFAARREQLRIGEIYTQNTLKETLKDVKSLLTFSHSSTVINALLELAKEGLTDKEIYILESRPLKEGERSVRSLVKAGFRNVNLGIDFAVNEFSKHAEIAVLGADMIHMDGRVLNKIGSTTISKLFHNLGKEVVVAASISKICLRSKFEKDRSWRPSIPQRNPKEITRLKHSNLTIWNKYFEIIPPELISLLILDQYKFYKPIETQLQKFLEKSSLTDQIDILQNSWNISD